MTEKHIARLCLRIGGNHMKRKLLACLVAACALCTTTAVLSSCGNVSKKDSDVSDVSTKDSLSTQEISVDWQFIGEYHELMSHGFDFYFLGNMLSDGKGIVYQAQWNNGNVTYSEINLKWETVTDRDGLVTFKASTHDSSAAFKDVSMYAEDDGTFNWEYKFLFAGGYSRTTSLLGKNKAEYANIDEWKGYVEKEAGKNQKEEEPETPTKQTILTFAGENGNSIEFYSDHTANIKAYNGAINFEYTWEVKDGIITMTSVKNPSEKITSTTVDGVTTIEYSASLGGNQVKLTFTCNDISALG